MSNQRKIIFLHLPKTAGTSLVNILHQEYRLENSALLAGDDQEAITKAIKEEKLFIHGHFSYNLIEKLNDPDYFKATLLRDASDRVISRYVHLAYSKEPRLREEFYRYKSFEDYLESSFADNWQCRMLSGIWHEERVDETVFRKALANLSKFDWIATAEDMPEAALDLSLKLGFESYYQPRLNRRKSEDLWQQVDRDYRLAIESLNAFDQKLVDFARRSYRAKRRIPILKRWKLALKRF